MRRESYIKYSLFTSILIALGPILWLFINIYDKNYGSIILNIVLVILALTLVFYNLKNYLRSYKKQGNTKLEVFKHLVSFILYILLMAVMLIFFIVLYTGITIIQEKLFIKEEYITYLIKSPYSYLIFVILIIVTSKLIMTVDKQKIEFFKKKIFFSWLNIDRILMLLIIPLLYIVLTSVVVVTKDGIYDYSFFDLKGERYNFSDIKYVDTGFITKRRNKGEFFYNIKLENGKELKLAHPSSSQASDKYDDDTWQEYVDIDEYIMDSGAIKEASEKGSNYVKMDQIYIDKLLKVIRNK